jgi:hypothetical protein
MSEDYKKVTPGAGASSVTEARRLKAIANSYDNNPQKISRLTSSSIPVLRSINTVRTSATFVRTVPLLSLGALRFIPTSMLVIVNGVLTGFTGSIESYNALVMPATVTSIGALAFLNATSLTTVTIGINVTSIGAEAFIRE